METTQYVIAIKPIKDFCNNPIPVENQDYRYASIDYFLDNPMGLIFGKFTEDTVTFNSIEQAELWWENSKRLLIHFIKDGYYDESTLCIQKRIVKVETETIKEITL